MAFALTEEAIEDNLYDRLGARYTRALARSMAHTKQVKAAAVLNNAFDSNFAGGDGVELCADCSPTIRWWHIPQRAVNSSRLERNFA